MFPFPIFHLLSSNIPSNSFPSLLIILSLEFLHNSSSSLSLYFLPSLPILASKSYLIQRFSFSLSSTPFSLKLSSTFSLFLHYILSILSRSPYLFLILSPVLRLHFHLLLLLLFFFLFPLQSLLSLFFSFSPFLYIDMKKII